MGCIGVRKGLHKGYIRIIGGLYGLCIGRGTVIG